MRTGDMVAALLPEIFCLPSFELRNKNPLSSPCKWLVETASYFFLPLSSFKSERGTEFTMSYPGCAHVGECVYVCECLCMCVHVRLCTCVHVWSLREDKHVERKCSIFPKCLVSATYHDPGLYI